MMRETRRRRPWKLAHLVTGAENNTGQTGLVYKGVPTSSTISLADGIHTAVAVLSVV